MAKPRDLIPVAVIHLISLLGNRLRGLQNPQSPFAVPATGRPNLRASMVWHPILS